MSHVDEGELTAYADGAYPAEHPDAQRIAAHLSECADCRTRLAQSEDLRGRAAAILAFAAPASVSAPAFETLRQEARPEARPTTFPLAWAATIVLAAGLGWFGRGMWQYEPARDTISMPTGAPAARQSQPPTPAQAEPSAAQPAAPPPAMIATGEAAPEARSAAAPAARRRAARTELAAAEAEEDAAIDEIAATDAMANTPAPPPPPQAPPVATAASERPVVPRDVLLAHPIIADLPLKSVLTSGDTTIVEQTLADGKTITLTMVTVPKAAVMAEARKSVAANDVAQQAAAGMAARTRAEVVVTVGNRTIRVQGDVSTDSLRALADKIR